MGYVRQNKWLSYSVVSLPSAWPVLNRGAMRDIEKMGFSCSQHVHGHCDARKIEKQKCQDYKNVSALKCW